MINCIGHTAFQVTDLEASLNHATNVLGFHEVGRADGSVFLSHGPLQHSLEFREGPVTALDHVAMQARDSEALDELAARLRAADYEVSDEQRSDPHVERNIRFHGAGGHAFDIFVPAESAIEGYSWQGQAPAVAHGARPRRAGHANLNFSDVEGAKALFTDIFGFKVSDIITEPDGKPLLYFFRCNHMHHVIGAANAPDGHFHYAFEVDNIGELVRLGDSLDAVGGKLLWGPGRHGAGDNIATYHADPSGVLIEYYTDMHFIEDDRWEPRSWSVDDYRLNNVWGVSPDVGPLFEASIPVVAAEAGSS